MTMQVAVIGAGAAGICAARHLAHSSGRATPHVFEHASCIGGTWVFTPQTGKDSRGEPIHSSMYKDLRTNLPKEVMAFPDFAFKNTDQSFLHHSQVLQYLEEYCKHYDLYKYIKFNSKIVSVEPVVNDANGNENWDVQYKNLETQEVHKAKFDAVLVCNGHYSEPRYPQIPGLEKFTGKIVHSHDFRYSEDFKDENIVILGAAASGTDIAVEISKSVNQVYLSHNNPFLPNKLPANVAQVRGIESCGGPNGFILTDGSRLMCDSLILATGYNYSFPFLSNKCGISVENNQVKPLYKHFLNIEHPTMALIGMPLQICPLPLFDNQIRYFLKILLKEVDIPTKVEMYSDTEKEKIYRLETLGMREKDFHKMGDLQWDYNAEIAKLADIQPLPQVIESLYREVWRRRKVDLVNYKNDKFIIKDLDTFTEKKI